MMESLFKKRAAMTAVIHSKSERIDVRASAPVKQLLQEAARVAHKNVSEFLLDAGIIAANQTLADRTRFELSDEKKLAHIFVYHARRILKQLLHGRTGAHIDTFGFGMNDRGHGAAFF